MIQSTGWLLLFLIIILGVGVGSKPINESSFDPSPNESNTGTRKDHRKSIGVDVGVKESLGRSLNPERMSEILRGAGTTMLSRELKEPNESKDVISNENTKQDIDLLEKGEGGFEWILGPLAQKIQFSPEVFVKESIGQLKDTLANFSSIFPNQQNAVSKQLAGAAGGLANLVGLNNDSGFYTNRFDPVGFFGGNGWFANKGGLLGGPGALISTGSLFTDYPTAYKK